MHRMTGTMNANLRNLERRENKEEKTLVSWQQTCKPNNSLVGDAKLEAALIMMKSIQSMGSARDFLHT